MISKDLKTYFLALALTGGVATTADAACCSPSQYYNQQLIAQYQQAARLRSIQQEQRVCQSIARSARTRLPAACMGR